jgi:cob(I)alamin adenosyltransferase
MSIYTRTGDTGFTSLFGGRRVPKSDELVGIYGSIDELNSWVGHIISSIPQNEVKNFLQEIQSDLFTVGSVFAGWNGDLSSLKKRVKAMEDRIDLMEKSLSPLTNFILPGGSSHGAYAHITRSICRRVERQVVALFYNQPSAVSLRSEDKHIILMYINRLSDLFFVLARFINKTENISETVWSGIPKGKKQS